MAIFPDCAEPGPSVVSCRPEDGIRDRRRGGSLSAAWRASTGRRSPADPMSRAMRSSSAGRDVRCFCVTDDLFGAPFLRRRAGMRGGRTGRFPSGLGRMVGRLFRTRPSASFPPSERRPPDGSSALRGHGLRLENAAGAARTPDVLRLSGILRRSVGHLRLSRDIYLIGWRVVCKIPKNGDCRVSRNRRSL